MTEQEWLHGTKSEIMLIFLKGKASERKMRLFLVACARTAWDRFEDATLRKAVETAERYADGLVSEADFDTSRNDVYSLIVPHSLSDDSFRIPFMLSLACGSPKYGLDRIETMNSWRIGH